MLEDGGLIKKAKGIEAVHLHYNDYLDLLNHINIKGFKKTALKYYSQGSVEILEEEVLLRSSVYIRRIKLYKGSEWIDTKPIFINTIDKQLVLYSPFSVKPSSVKPVIITPDVIYLSEVKGGDDTSHSPDQSRIY